MKPFAIQLYERYIRGESVEHLAAVLNIPVERIAARLRAAERHLQEHAGRHEGRRRAGMSGDAKNLIPAR